MRWLGCLGGVVILAVAVGLLGSPAAGCFAGLFGGVAVLFAWRAGVVGDTSRAWARELYGSGDRDGSGYAAVMARQVRGAGRSGSGR
jgi:hypothetical protein